MSQCRFDAQAKSVEKQDCELVLAGNKRFCIPSCCIRTLLHSDHQDTFESAIQKRFGRTACLPHSHKALRKDGS
jgi:hypothetical protein